MNKNFTIQVKIYAYWVSIMWSLKELSYTNDANISGVEEKIFPIFDVLE